MNMTIKVRLLEREECYRNMFDQIFAKDINSRCRTKIFPFKVSTKLLKPQLLGISSDLSFDTVSTVRLGAMSI